LATGLTTAITKDGQTTTTARITFAQGITSSLVTDSSSVSTGSIITGGGVGIAKALYVGTTANVAGDASINGLTVGKGGGALSTNSAVGVSALNATNTGSLCTAFGYQALKLTTGKECTAVGANAGASMTSGEALTALGYNAANLNTGNSITALGHNALGSNTTGDQSTAVGSAALIANTTGSYNVAMGRQALVANTTASNNTAIGYQAGYGKTTGGSNTFLGYFAGGSITTGNNNLCIGQSAGGVLTTGASNIYIGSGSNTASAAGADSEILICTGNQTGKGNSTGHINPNGGGVYQGNNSAAWSVASDRRLKKNIVDNTEGLDIISQIRVRNFEYRTTEEVTELPASQVIDKQGVQLGVIAQELLEVCGDCVKTESTGVMSVNQENITWHMVNAIKDLKAIVDTQAAEIAELKAKVA